MNRLESTAQKRWCKQLENAGYVIGNGFTFHCYRLLNPMGDRTAAELAYRELLAALPNHPEGLEGLAFLLQLQGRSAEAVEYRERLLRLHARDLGIDDSHQMEVTAYLLAGEGRAAPPRQAPPAYVRGLFDGYAERFDTHLLDKLHYRGPELLFTSMRSILNINSASLDILDIGCGTGLTGALFRPLAKRLDGLDLSPIMLEKAAQRQIYDRLEQGEILEQLPHLRQLYDLVIAADVLNYFGDLQLVLHAVYEVLSEGAYTVFSVEKGATAGYRLRSTGRYQHHPAYVRGIAQCQGYETISYQESTLREQDGQPVKAVIFLLQRPHN